MEIKKINTKWVISIPEEIKVLVKEGEKVESGQCLAEITIVNEKVIDYAKLFEKLSLKDRGKFVKDLEGKAITVGEVIFDSGGMFGKKIMASESGMVIKIDEFYNVHLKLTDDKVNKILSPTEAVVTKIDKEKIVLEFKAEEYLGKGIVEGRGWGIEGIKEINRLVDLSVNDEGKIMVTKNLSPTLLTKAEVVGITGVVVLDDGKLDKDDKINFKLPVLAVEEKVYKRLSESLVTGKRALINATNGRLLLIR